MVSILISRFVILTCGTLYPAYRSYKTVKTKNVREYVKWMMYWIVFAIFLCTEALADTFVSFWFPFYYEAKILFVVWLISPYTKGASFIYRKFIHPLLVKHEQDIDQYLDKAKNDSYKTLMRFGSKTIVYAKEVVATAAIRGQEQLVNQLKKSYSLGDVSEIVEDEDLLDSGRRRRETVNNLQMSTNVVDADGSVHVWEGHYGVDGKKIEKQLVDFIDSDESSSNTIEELLGQQAKPVLKTKDDNAVGVGRSSASSTASVANKSSLQKRREIDIYATTSRRGPVTRSTGATSTILKK